MRKHLSTLFTGIACTTLAVFEYGNLTAREAAGHVEDLNYRIKWLYEIGGKWAVVGVFAAVGVGCLGYLAGELIKARRPVGGARPMAAGPARRDGAVVRRAGQ